jgi:general secretion pathway protein G
MRKGKNNMHSIQANRQEGFTFVELMIVILIMGILLGGAAIGYKAWTDRARKSTTKTNMLTIKRALSMFNEEHGQYPNSLKDLVERPQGEKFAGGEWQPSFEKEPLDGWKHPFMYKVTPKAKHPYELISYGSSSPEDPDPDQFYDVWNI